MTNCRRQQHVNLWRGSEHRLLDTDPELEPGAEVAQAGRLDKRLVPAADGLASVGVDGWVVVTNAHPSGAPGRRDDAVVLVPGTHHARGRSRLVWDEPLSSLTSETYERAEQVEMRRNSSKRAKVEAARPSSMRGANKSGVHKLPTRIAAPRTQAIAGGWFRWMVQVRSLGIVPSDQKR